MKNEYMVRLDRTTHATPTAYAVMKKTFHLKIGKHFE